MVHCAARRATSRAFSAVSSMAMRRAIGIVRPLSLEPAALFTTRPCKIPCLQGILLETGAISTASPASAAQLLCPVLLRRPRLLELPAVARHRKAEHEVDHRDEEIDLDAEGLPGRIDDRGLGGGQEV